MNKLEKLREQLKRKTKPVEKKESLQNKFDRYIDSVAPAAEPDRAPAEKVEWKCPSCNRTYTMYRQDIPIYKCDKCLMGNRR